MKTIWLPIATAMGLCFALTGCSLNSVDLSPDGKTVAIVGDHGLELRPANETKGRLILPEQCEEPVFSPDGRSIATFIRRNKRTVVIDVDSGRQSETPNQLTPPYAWNPEGTELVGWRDEDHAAVFHPASKTFVRSYALKMPHEVVRLGGREMALLYQDHVSYFHGGKVTDTPFLLPQGNSLRGDTHRIEWIEMEDISPQDGIPDMHVVIRTLDLDTGNVSTLRDIPKTSALIQSEHAYFSATFSLSPDGSRLAFTGFVDGSAPGVLERALELARLSRQHPNDRSIDRQSKAIQKQIRLLPLTATSDTVDGAFEIQPATAPVAEAESLPQKLLWSADGKSLAVVYAKTVNVLRLP